jgi:hypothetical protein
MLAIVKTMLCLVNMFIPLISVLSDQVLKFENVGISKKSYYYCQNEKLDNKSYLWSTRFNNNGKGIMVFILPW